MTTNRKTTTALIVLAGIAATLLVAGTVAVASNHSAFAWKDQYKKQDNYSKDENYNKGYDKSSTDGGTNIGGSGCSDKGCDVQAIIQSNSASQESTVTTAGANSPIQNSGNQAITQSNTNNGGNAQAK